MKILVAAICVNSENGKAETQRIEIANLRENGRTEKKKTPTSENGNATSDNKMRLGKDLGIGGRDGR